MRAMTRESTKPSRPTVSQTPGLASRAFERAGDFAPRVAENAILSPVRAPGQAVWPPGWAAVHDFRRLRVLDTTGTALAGPRPFAGATGPTSRMAAARLDSSRNPAGASAEEDATAGPTAPASSSPSPATPAPAGPPAPALNCEVISGPSYSPGGSIPVTSSGGRKKASFSFSATFGQARGALQRFGQGIRSGAATGAGIGLYFLGVGAIPGAILGGLIGGIAGLLGQDSTASCCEVRQYIKWDKRYVASKGGPPHGGFPSSSTPDTWYEDRDENNKRYGHRSGPYSDPMPNCEDEYKTGSAPDQANGDTYCGSDEPGAPDRRQGQYQFQLKVVDVCHGEAVKATSSVITVDWG